MMKLERFEDIVAWQEARRMTGLIYELTKRSEFSKDFGLKNQIQRAAVSVMANIAEGFERKSRKEFCNFLSVALGSCAEVKSHLYVALDQKYIPKTAFDQAFIACTHISRLVFALMKSLERARTS